MLKISSDNILFSKTFIIGIAPATAASKNKAKELENLREKIDKIKNCKLKEFASNLVFSDGNPNAKIMIIGASHSAIMCSLALLF